MPRQYLTALLALVSLISIISLPSLTLSTPVPAAPPLEHYQRLMKRANATIITECTVPNSFAVTFDDGPSLWTHELLDYLAIKNIKVTFFVNGINYVSIEDPEFAAVVINWVVDSNDWRHPTDYKTDFQAYRVALQDPSAVGKGWISLQHDAEQGTAQVFSKLAIEYVLSKGFQVMPVASCLGDTTGWYRV
ncbi:Carbohydrate esterase 4 protein [Mortierella alpina]|uniref:Carbohydrate esterase 4 protein n=1 Tax=Mortierella alpina TaxID=64518 RepID=A0A9P6J999_MORAP|nr:Carbohydrate esterase 4 protein [Mortierella alpina]